MEQILESLQVSEEIKNQLVESFDKAVFKEAIKLAESKESEYEEYMKEEIDKSIEALTEKLDAYLEKVVSDFISENEAELDAVVESEKYEAIMEGFESMLVATGVEIKQIAESYEETIEESQESSSDLADSLMEENIGLKEKNAELLKTGLIKETMEGLTEVQKDRFMRLANMIEYDARNPVKFIEKLDTLSETVLSEGSKKTATFRDNKPNEKIIVEKYTPTASHLF